MKISAILLILSGLCFYCADAAKEGNDEFKLATLLEESKKNQTSLNESQQIFRQNYDKSRFVLHGPFVNDNTSEIVEHRSSIHLQNFDVIKYVLDHFGHMIHKIHVKFEHIDVKEANEIVEKINHYSNSLETLAIEDCKGDVLHNLNNTFPYVFTLKFSSSPMHQLEVNSEFKLNRIFTDLFALHLEHTTDFSFIGDKCANLVYLNVKLRKSREQNHEDTTRVIHFLKENPQIQHLAVHNCNLNLVKMANEILSQLNFLSVVNLSEDYSDYHDEPIQLDGVRMLTVEVDNENELPLKIVFANLERLKLIIKKFTDKWSEFLTSQVNTNLKHFAIDAVEISKEHFLDIAERLPELEAVDVTCTSKLETDDIVGFVGSSKSLKNFDLHLHMNESEQRRLSEVLPRDWNIVDQIQSENKVKISLKWESPITENDILSHLGVDSTQIVQQDFSLASLNNLNMVDLLKVSSLNEKCMDAVRRVFQKNYDKTAFILRGPFVRDGTQVIEEEQNFIHLHHFNLIAYILNNFGSSIHHVQVFFEDIDLHQSRRIIRKVIEKCAKSLETLTLDNYDRGLFDEMKAGFPYVSTLKFSTAQTEPIESITTSTSMNKIFPNLNDLEVLTASDWVFIDGHFSKLEKFSVKLNELKERNEEIASVVVDFLKKNPQITTLVLEYGSLNLLKEANDILSHLKNLELKNLVELKYEGDPIDLNTVEYLSIESDHENRTLEKAVFHRLNILRLKLRHEFSDKWAEFLANHVNTELSKLSLVSEGMTIDQLLNIPEKQSSLQSVDISCDLYLAADDIMTFIGKSKRLNDLQLKVQLGGREQYRLNEIVPLDWDLECSSNDSDSVKVSLERLKECPSTSLVRLDLIDLLKRSSAFKECQDEARKVFTAKYDKSLVIVRGPFDENARSDIEVQEESIHLTNLNVIKHFLSQFGDLVRGIQVSFDEIDEAEAKEVLQYINDKCSNTLERLSLKFQEESVLNELRNEFRNVFALSLSSHSTYEIKNGSDIIRLSIIFPYLRELYLDSTTFWTIIGEVMSKLKKLIVHLSKEKTPNEASTSNVIKFLKSNSQIEHLSIQHGSLNLLKEVNAILLQLESLEISFAENYMYYEGEPIHFETVRHLSIDLDYANRIPTKIVFKQLERLRLVVQHEFTKQWIEFIEGQINPSVKHLDIEFAGLSLEHFLDVPEKLRDLKAVKITCDSNFVANDVVLFMKKSRQISDLVLNFRMNAFEQNRLQTVLARKWQITYQPHEDQTVLIDIKPKSREGSSSATPDLTVLLEKPIINDGKLTKAQEMFKSKYLQSQFMFRGPFVENMQKAIEVYNDGQWVIVHNLNAIKNLLEYFGHLGIHTIEIDFQEIDMENGKKIVEYIDKIAKSLNVLYLENCKDDILNGLKSEFTNLSILRFSSRSGGFNLNNKLSKLFLNLQSFFIDHTESSDWRFIDCNLPKLINVEMELPQTTEEDEIYESQIVKFLKVNPQIERLKLGQSNLKLIAAANEHLPKLYYLKLEQLSTDYLNDQIDLIHFKHLTHFSLRSFHVDEIPEKIMFEQLQKLDLILYPNQYTVHWSEFIENQVNVNLNEFALDVGKLTVAQLFSIPGQLQNLKKITISSSSEFTAEEVVDFVAKSSSLMNLNLECLMEKWEQDRLNELLPIKFKLNTKTQRDDNVKITIKWEEEKVVDPLNVDDYSNGNDGLSEDSTSNAASKPDTENPPNNPNTGDENGAAFLLTNHSTLVFAVILILAINNMF